jgi:hypothetical protein
MNQLVRKFCFVHGENGDGPKTGFFLNAIIYENFLTNEKGQAV